MPWIARLPSVVGRLVWHFAFTVGPHHSKVGKHGSAAAVRAVRVYTASVVRDPGVSSCPFPFQRVSLEGGRTTLCMGAAAVDINRAVYWKAIAIVISSSADVIHRQTQTGLLDDWRLTDYIHMGTHADAAHTQWPAFKPACQQSVLQTRFQPSRLLLTLRFTIKTNDNDKSFHTSIVSYFSTPSLWNESAVLRTNQHTVMWRIVLWYRYIVPEK